MSNPRCDQCEHWMEVSPEWQARNAGFRKCHGVRTRWDIVDTALEGIEWSPHEDGAYAKARDDAIRASRAYVQDASTYVAELLTGPDFFCALFTPQGPKP